MRLGVTFPDHDLDRKGGLGVKEALGQALKGLKLACVLV